MDPIRTLLAFLAERLPQFDADIEARVRDLFSKFELVPKHEYEAQIAVLHSLESQVHELEARVARFESDT